MPLPVFRVEVRQQNNKASVRFVRAPSPEQACALARAWDVGPVVGVGREPLTAEQAAEIGKPKAAPPQAGL
jgi:hypothetical protein